GRFRARPATGIGNSLPGTTAPGSAGGRADAALGGTMRGLEGTGPRFHGIPPKIRQGLDRGVKRRFLPAAYQEKAANNPTAPFALSWQGRQFRRHAPAKNHPNRTRRSSPHLSPGQDPPHTSGLG